MGELLNELMPRIFPRFSFEILRFEGKNNLDNNVLRTIRAWGKPGVRFIVLRDQNSDDCHSLKIRLAGLCSKTGRRDVLVRIVCRELEAWYLGEPDALADAYGNDRLRNIKMKAKYRNPDAVARPADEVSKLVPEFKKVSGARMLGARLTRAGNRSRSFQALLAGLDRFEAELNSLQPPSASARR